MNIEKTSEKLKKRLKTQMKLRDLSIRLDPLIRLVNFIFIKV